MMEIDYKHEEKMAAVLEDSDFTEFLAVRYELEQALRQARYAHANGEGIRLPEKIQQILDEWNDRR